MINQEKEKENKVFYLLAETSAKRKGNMARQSNHVPGVYVPAPLSSFTLHFCRAFIQRDGTTKLFKFLN